MKPQPKSFPITETTIGFTHDARIRGVTEIYLPEKFENIQCVVENLRYELESFQQLRLIVDFKLICDQSDVDNLYDEEDWKFMSTRNCLEHFPEIAQKLNNPAPIFLIMLSKFLRVSDAVLKIDGTIKPVVFDQTLDITVLPKSYPPLCDLPQGKSYSYFDKKTTAFYADLFPNKLYSLEIEFESCGTFENAPLFPFGNVLVKKASAVSNSDLDVHVFCDPINPTYKDEFPDRVEYNFEKLTNFEDHLPPLRIPALPFRGEETLFNLGEKFIELHKEFLKTKKIPKIPDNMMRSLETIASLKLSSYEALRMAFSIVIPPNKNFEIVVRTMKGPVPARIYEQMQSLPNYQDFLVEYDIINLSGKKARLRVETEITGFTEKEAKTIFIHNTNNNADQSARKRISQCPRLLRGVLESMANPEKATMICKVKDEDKKEILYEETFKIEFLPQDQIIWSMRDVRNEHFYSLGSFIGAWIYPNDKGGLFDKVRIASVKYNPRGYMGMSEGTLGEVMLHAKAVYEYLSNDLGLKYVSQPGTALNENDSQRVVLPEKVLENKAGNCIDLTVLFASLLEGFGIYSLIFLTEDHAFIGWGNPLKTSEMIFLETTALGTRTFEEAMQIGKKTFKEKFLFVGSENPIPDLLPSMKSRKIVDLRKVREQGIRARI